MINSIPRAGSVNSSGARGPNFSLSAVLAMLFGLAAGAVHADEISKSVAVACDPEGVRFSILADIRADSPKAGPFHGSQETNIERLERGEFVRECSWKGTTVRASIISWSATTGMCGGAGGALLKSIAVNGRELGLARLELSDYERCHSDRPYPAGITVTSEPDGEYLQVCLARWSWEDGWQAAECTKAKVTLSTEGLSPN